MQPKLLQPDRVIVQGITGTHGAFHTRQMISAGTQIVAGTSPNKAGTYIEGVPVYGSISDIMQHTLIDASVIFVPPQFALDAIMEAIDANVPLIICITEGIPIHDMLAVRQRLSNSSSTLIGPNCPGILLPGLLKLGIIPHSMGRAGTIGIVSRSGTLTYEATDGLSRRGLGQKYVIGIGGDAIHGVGFIDCLTLFQNDPGVDKIILIGEIGGREEIEAAHYIENHVTKPIYAYIAGHSAPKGIQLGHAGAILGSEEESASFKSKTLEQAGAHIAPSIAALVSLVK